MFNTILNSYSFLILMIIGIQHKKTGDRKSLQYQLFFLMLITNIILLFVDTMGRFDGKDYFFYPFLNHTGNFLLYFFNLIFPCAWVLYAHYQTYRNERQLKKIIIPLLILNLINLVFIIISQFTEFYYYINSDNIYRRGKFYPLALGIIVLMLILSITLIVRGKRCLSKKHFYYLLFFPFFPALGVVLQTSFYGTSIQYSGTTLALLLIFLNVQSDQIYTDSLTGLNNSRKLLDYLGKKISTYSTEKDLSVILLCVDDFTSINEKFGKKFGDEILKDLAKLLKNSLLGKFFVAKLSGSDFCIVLDESDIKKITNIMSLIHNNFKSYSKKNHSNLELNLRMEYAIYNDPDLKLEEFLNELDKNLQTKR